MADSNGKPLPPFSHGVGPVNTCHVFPWLSLTPEILTGRLLHGEFVPTNAISVDAPVELNALVVCTVTGVPSIYPLLLTTAAVLARTVDDTSDHSRIPPNIAQTRDETFICIGDLFATGVPESATSQNIYGRLSRYFCSQRTCLEGLTGLARLIPFCSQKTYGSGCKVLQCRAKVLPHVRLFCHTHLRRQEPSESTLGELGRRVRLIRQSKLIIGSE
jgi:hypothetical protein